jgi:hypothetical protein
MSIISHAAVSLTVRLRTGVRVTDRFETILRSAGPEKGPCTGSLPARGLGSLARSGNDMALSEHHFLAQNSRMASGSLLMYVSTEHTAAPVQK